MILMGIALWISGLVHAATPAKANNDNILRLLDKKVRVFQSGGAYVDVFLDLCHDLAIPCGEERFSGEILVWAPVAGNYREESMPLRVALDMIVKRQPQYRWDVSEGVLLLSPRNVNKNGPLDKAVTRFSADADVLDGVTNRVIDIMGIQHNLGLGSSMFTESTRKLNFELKNTSPRAILNAAVRAEGNSIWRFTYLSKAEQESMLDHPSVDLKSYTYSNSRE